MLKLNLVVVSVKIKSDSELKSTTLLLHGNKVKVFKKSYQLFITKHLLCTLKNINRFSDTLSQEIGQCLTFCSADVLNFHLSADIVIKKQEVYEKILSKLSDTITIEGIFISEEDPSIFTLYTELECLKNTKLTCFQIKFGGGAVKTQFSKKQSDVAHITLIGKRLDDETLKVINFVEALSLKEEQIQFQEDDDDDFDFDQLVETAYDELEENEEFGSFHIEEMDAPTFVQIDPKEMCVKISQQVFLFNQTLDIVEKSSLLSLIPENEKLLCESLKGEMQSTLCTEKWKHKVDVIKSQGNRVVRIRDRELITTLFANLSLKLGVKLQVKVGRWKVPDIEGCVGIYFQMEITSDESGNWEYKEVKRIFDSSQIFETDNDEICCEGGGAERKLEVIKKENEKDKKRGEKRKKDERSEEKKPKKKIKNDDYKRHQHSSVEDIVKLSESKKLCEEETKDELVINNLKSIKNSLRTLDSHMTKLEKFCEILESRQNLKCGECPLHCPQSFKIRAPQGRPLGSNGKSKKQT